LLRDHHAPKVRAAMKIWLAHVYRYSRRDQLSNSVAFHLAGLKPAVLALDNFESDFHSWPHVSGRKTEGRSWRDETADAVVLRSEYLSLQQTLGDVQQTVCDLQREHDAARHEFETLKYQRDEMQRERDTLLHENGLLLHERNTLQHQRNVLRHERDGLQRSVDALLDSMSWRVTAPLRGLKIAATALKNRLAVSDRNEVL
jgi:chromosome segregation ATPase